MQLTWLWARNAFELGLGFEIVPREGDSDLWKSKIQHRENCSFQRTKFHDSREEEFTFFEFAKFTRENSRRWNRFPQHTLVNQRAPIALIYDCLHQRGIGVCRKATTRGIQHHRHPMNYAFRGMLSTLLPFARSQSTRKNTTNARTTFASRHHEIVLQRNSKEIRNFIYISFYIIRF